MVNTNLPENIVPNAPNHDVHHSLIHPEVNRLSQDTGWRIMPLRNGWQFYPGGYLRIRRIMSHWTVISMSGLDPSNATSDVMAEFNSNPTTGVDSNYRGFDPLRAPVFRTSVGDVEIRIAASQLRNVGRNGIPAGQAFEWVFISDRVTINVPGDPM